MIFSRRKTFAKSCYFTLIYLLISVSLSYITLAQTESDNEEITIDSSLVILNTTITDRKGNSNIQLSKDQFEVFEDGEKQEVSFFSKQDTPFAAVILIDTSGSMLQRVSMARSATIKFLDGIRPDDYVAIYNFDSKVSLVQDFSNIRDLTPQAFDLKARGWTVLNDAVFKASKKLQERKEKRKAIVVLSDGADTKSGRSANKALKEAIKSNITIYTVDMSAINSGGKRRMQNRGVLRNFAKKSGGQFIETPGGVQMRKAFDTIVKDLGVQYTLGYYPKNITKDGKWRKIELKVRKSNLKVRTREGYNAPKK